MLLNVKDMKVAYGAIEAVRGIDISVEEGEIVTIIGSNGAGKSSTMNALAGLIKCKSGTIEFMGKDVTNASNTSLVQSGLVLVPEGRQVFDKMTVQENLALGAYLYYKEKERVSKQLKYVYEMFPRLKERENQLGGTLSGGEQQMLAVARALMSFPKLLMLDEPSLGLAPIIVTQIFEMLLEINRNGTTILLVEQNAKLALTISDRAYALETGRIVLSGDAQDLVNDPRVKDAYL